MCDLEFVRAYAYVVMHVITCASAQYWKHLRASRERRDGLLPKYGISSQTGCPEGTENGQQKLSHQKTKNKNFSKSTNPEYAHCFLND